MPVLHLSLDTSQLRSGAAQAEASLDSVASASDRLEKKTSSLEDKLSSTGRILGKLPLDIREWSSAVSRISSGKEFVSVLKDVQQQADLSDKALLCLAKNLGATAKEMQELQGAAATAGSGVKNSANNFKNVGGEADILGSKIERLVRKYATLVLSWSALKSAAKSILTATLEAEKLASAYETVIGSVQGAQVQMAHMREITDRLGLEFSSTAEAARGFFAAGVGTSLAKDLDSIFTGVATAASALSMSEQEINRVFRALSQMISKGVVQASELRNEFGSALPGGFALAAEAMGMTTQELSAFMSKGELLASDLLPRLGQALQDKYAEPAKEAASGLSAELNRLSSAWEDLKASFVSSETVAQGVGILASALKDLSEISLEDVKRAINTPLAFGVMAGLSTPEVPQNEFRGKIDPTPINLPRPKPASVLQSKKKSGRANGEVAQERALQQAESLYQRAARAAEQLELKNISLAESLEGESLATNLARIEREYQAQIAAIERDLADLDKKQAEWSKKGLNTPEVQGFVEQYQAEAEKQRELLSSQKEINAALAERASLEADLGSSAAYAKLTGDSRAYWKAQKDLLALELQRTQNISEKARLEREMAYARAREGGDGLALTRFGLDQAQFQAQEEFLDFFEKSIPNATQTASNAFGNFVASVSAGTQSASSFFKSMESVLENTVNQMVSTLASALMNQAISGIMGGVFGGGGGLLSGIGSLFGFADGGVFRDAPGLSSLSNTIVDRPTAFTFGQNLFASGAGLMGEAGAEAIMPLSRNSQGRLGVNVSGLGGSAPVFNVIINTPPGVAVTDQEHKQNNQGGFDLDLFMDMVDKSVAAGISSGRSRTANALNQRTRMLNAR